MNPINDQTSTILSNIWISTYEVISNLLKQKLSIQFPKKLCLKKFNQLSSIITESFWNQWFCLNSSATGSRPSDNSVWQADDGCQILTWCPLGHTSNGGPRSWSCANWGVVGINIGNSWWSSTKSIHLAIITGLDQLGSIEI